MEAIRANNHPSQAPRSTPTPAMSSSRFPRRLRVFTEPKHSSKMHRTRTLSELILLSPCSSPRIIPGRKRLEMDIEVSANFAEGEGLVDLFSLGPRVHSDRTSFFSDNNSEETVTTAFTDVNISEEGEAEHEATEHESNNSADDEERWEDVHMVDAEAEAEAQGMAANDHDASEIAVDPQMDSEDNQNEVEPEAEPEVEAELATPERSVSEVIDVLFEIHSALKTKHLGQRTAASALAASNLVSTLAYPPAEPVPRDEQVEMLDNMRKMLECAICQEVFTNATEATCCGQIFCKECIERWVSERGSCPMCRESIGFSLLVSSRHAQRMANELKVTCPYCSKAMKKAILADHMNVCEMAPVEPPPPADVALRRMMISTARLNFEFMQRFLIAPSPPQAAVMQCYIRTRGGGNYELYTQDTDTLLLTAVRRRQYDMSVSFHIFAANDLQGTSGNPPLIARLEKNYMGSQYTMFDTTGEQPIELGAVQYAATFGKSPRQMRVALPLVQQLADVDTNVEGVPSWAVQPWQPQFKEDTILGQVDAPDATRSMSLINKPPVWIESLEAYCLDFGGRVAAASVKNFLLSHPDDMDKTLMLFGRTQDRQVYSMDYCHPFSPVQAFAIALSSMDSHLVTFD